MLYHGFSKGHFLSHIVHWKQEFRTRDFKSDDFNKNKRFKTSTFIYTLCTENTL